MTVTDWKKKPDPRPRMKVSARRRQATRLKIQKDRERLEGNDDKMDVTAVRAAVERWEKKRQ